MTDELNEVLSTPAETGDAAPAELPVKKARRPRRTKAEMEAAAAQSATDGKTPVKRGKKSEVGTSTKDIGPKEAKKAQLTPSSLASDAVDEFEALVQLERENNDLRKQLSEKLRSENAELRKRLGDG
jgi:hypothetical protein